MKLVLVSDAGDPASARTWSGTPANLMRALREQGCDVSALDITPPRWFRAALSLCTLLGGRGREYRRTPLAGLYARLKLPSGPSPDTVFLHISTSTVPPRGNSRHAVYIDSTFHQMSVHTVASYSDALRQKYDRYEGRALAAADLILPISACTAQDAVAHYGIPPERVAVTGTGRGAIRPSDAPRDYASNTILFVAKQRFQEKGGHLLLDAFRLAQRANPALKLIAVATEPYRGVIESVPGARYASNLSWEELEALFNTVSLFAMPALHEPWGLVYLEALSCGTPILGLNRNALPELTGNGAFGFLVDEATPAAVAEALLAVLSDPARLTAMGTRAREHVATTYGWDKTAQRILNALQSLAAL